MARKLTKKITKVQKVVKKQRPTAPVGNRSQAAVTPVAMPQGEFVEAIGRRKTASARVRLYKTTGDMIVNGKAIGQYFAGITDAHSYYNEPFVITDTKNEYALTAVVHGSGIEAQLEAVIHGTAQALVMLNPELRVPLKQAGMLTRDDRMKETRKVGMGGKARRKRQSPKR